MGNLMRKSTNDDYGLKELQGKILEIIIYIDEICNKYDIEYCLMGGSALGAKRHGGFIPWDDDLDIFMTPDNYEKFRNIFMDIGDKEKFYLQESRLIDGMVTIPKLRMNGTTYIEEVVKDWDIHHGIYVDIFILHTCPNNRLLQLYQCIWAKYVIMLSLSSRGYNKRKGITAFILKVMSLLPERFLLKRGLKEIYRYRNKETNYYCNFLGKAIFKKGIYNRAWFEETKYVPFETVELKVPLNLEDFLSERFGDYMKIPSADRIKWEQHAWKWDTKKDFRNYVSEVDNFSDEKQLF